MKENSGLREGNTDMITAASALTSLGKASERNEVMPRIKIDQNDRSKNKININFPSILMEILNNDNHSDVISWLHHGKSFFIKNKEKFSTQFSRFILSNQSTRASCESLIVGVSILFEV